MQSSHTCSGELVYSGSHTYLLALLTVPNPEIYSDSLDFVASHFESDDRAELNISANTNLNGHASLSSMKSGRVKSHDIKVQPY